MDFSPEKISTLINTYIIPNTLNLLIALLIFLIGKAVVKAIVNITEKIMKKSNIDEVLVHFIAGILNSTLLLFVIIAALSKLGINTTSLVALVGAAGLAVGLSLQNSLQNFAAGIMLITFRPFSAGDFVEVAGVMGVVEKITIFSTLLRTGDNKQITIPNGAIYGGVLINYSSKPTRRIDMIVGIGYQDDLLLAKNTLKEIVDADDRILKDPETTIAVAELGSSSVNFVLRPWVNNADYWAVKFDLTEKIKLTFDQKGISIPYPQMDVHVKQIKQN